MLWRGNRLTGSFSPLSMSRGRLSFFSQNRKQRADQPSHSRHFFEPGSHLPPNHAISRSRPTIRNLANPDTPEIWYTLAFLHNISTPLSTLASLIDDIIPSIQPSVASTLHSTVQSLLQATSLHSESLQGTWKKEKIEISHKTKKIVPLLYRLAYPYTLYVKLPDQRIFVQGNAAAWEQILVNLVKNSRETLESHRIDPWLGWIEIRLTSNLKTWRLTWSDSGWGVPPSIWRMVFTPLSKRWRPQPRGFGLRSVRFWWENTFHGSLQLRRWPRWRVVLEAPRFSAKKGV